MTVQTDFFESVESACSFLAGYSWGWRDVVLASSPVLGAENDLAERHVVLGLDYKVVKCEILKCSRTGGVEYRVSPAQVTLHIISSKSYILSLFVDFIPDADCDRRTCHDTVEHSLCDPIGMKAKGSCPTFIRASSPCAFRLCQRNPSVWNLASSRLIWTPA